MYNSGLKWLTVFWKLCKHSSFSVRVKLSWFLNLINCFWCLLTCLKPIKIVELDGILEVNSVPLVLTATSLNLCLSSQIWEDHSLSSWKFFLMPNMNLSWYIWKSVSYCFMQIITMLFAMSPSVLEPSSSSLLLYIMFSRSLIFLFFSAFSSLGL